MGGVNRENIHIRSHKCELRGALVLTEVAGFVQKKGAQEVLEINALMVFSVVIKILLLAVLGVSIRRQVHLNTCRLTGFLISAKIQRRVRATH